MGAKRNGWLEELTVGYELYRMPNGYWTKDKCHKEALRYTSRKEFAVGSGGAFHAAKRNGWYEDICSHMSRIGSLKSRLVYIAKFSGDICYIGITYNLEKRKIQHLNQEARDSKLTTVGDYIQYTGEEPVFEALTGYLDSQLAAEKEDEFITLYKKKGWRILNKQRGGGLGGSIRKWDFDSITSTTANYKTKADFMKNEPGAYSAASKQGILDEVTSDLESKRKPSGYWTKERCQIEASKYKTRTQLLESNGSAYRIAIRNGWLDSICLHMEPDSKPNGYWNSKENCAREAQLYTNRSAFSRESRGAHAASIKYGWLEEICQHMSSTHHRSGTWNNKSNCYSEALKYDKISHFEKCARGAYEGAKRNGWLQDVTAHMIRDNKPAGFWTKSQCKEEASKYQTKAEFVNKCASAYVTASKNGWLDEIASHMDAIIAPKGFWTIERCRSLAEKYQSMSEFRKNEPKAYCASKRNGWLDEVCDGLTRRKRKPNGYWTFERAQEEAKKYKIKEEFKKASGGAHRVALDNGWLSIFFPTIK